MDIAYSSSSNWSYPSWPSHLDHILLTNELFDEDKNDGYYDAFRSKNVNDVKWTFWDYQNGSWSKDHGIRIDHLMLSPEAVDKLIECEIDKEPRGKNKPSDHVPIWCKMESRL